MVSHKDYEGQHFEAVANDARVRLFVSEYLEKEERNQAVFIQSDDRLVTRLAFRAAMKKAFQWEFPLPDNALKALISSSEFDAIFEQTRPANAVSRKDYEAQHFEAVANDARVQVFVNEYLAKEEKTTILVTSSHSSGKRLGKASATGYDAAEPTATSRKR